MNYYLKKDLSELVRAKKCSSAFFAMRQGAAVPAIKKEGYLVEHASTATPGLITREFISVFEFESEYNPTDIATLDVTAIGTMITSFAAADITRPTITSTSPANNATAVATDATVTVTFSEAIAVISGKKAVIYVYDEETEAFVKVEDAPTMTVGGTGNKTLTIGHTDFDNEAIVKVIIPADTIEDASANGNNYNTAYSFTFTVIPELVAASVPADDATDVAVDANMVVTYNNALNDSTSTFALTKTSDASAIASDVTYDTAKKVVTVNPGASLIAATGYTLTCHAVDITGQIKETVITFTTAA
jgi:methionine-rich copper-binding protein CopC